jgi:hypothetical protein
VIFTCKNYRTQKGGFIKWLLRGFPSRYCNLGVAAQCLSLLAWLGYQSLSILLRVNPLGLTFPQPRRHRCTAKTGQANIARLNPSAAPARTNKSLRRSSWRQLSNAGRRGLRHHCGAQADVLRATSITIDWTTTLPNPSRVSTTACLGRWSKHGRWHINSPNYFSPGSPSRDFLPRLPFQPVV